MTLTLSRSRQYVVRVAFESSCTMQKYERCTNMPYNLLKEERKEEIKKKKCKNKTIKQETKKKENEKKIVSYFSITKYICKFIITPRIKSVYTSFWKGLDSVFLTSVSLKQAWFVFVGRKLPSLQALNACNTHNTSTCSMSSFDSTELYFNNKGFYLIGHIFYKRLPSCKNRFNCKKWWKREGILTSFSVCIYIIEWLVNRYCKSQPTSSGCFSSKFLLAGFCFWLFMTYFNTISDMYRIF